jgi:hypothetical protein
VTTPAPVHAHGIGSSWRGRVSKVLSTHNAEELARARRVEDLVVAAVGNDPRAERDRRVAELGQAYAEFCDRIQARWGSIGGFCGGGRDRLDGRQAQLPGNGGRLKSA